MPDTIEPRLRRTDKQLNIRVSSDDQALIDRAAKAAGMDRTTFILQAARGRAQETLLDQTWFVLPATEFDAFVARLDAPPAGNGPMADFLRRPAASWKA